MSMKVIRKYLLQDNEVKNILGGNHIYLVEKPEKIKTDLYTIYNYKPLTGGLLSGYQLALTVVGKELGKILNMQKRLIELLDEKREPIIIKDDETIIKTSRLSSGGGIISNPQSGNYEVVVYFYCEI